ncbi:MAG: hypothetical protein AAF514_11740 [Verrucomicrobiota bacterium]
MNSLSPAFWIFFAIGAIVSSFIVFYYARKNPNPRFRPRFGEVCLVSLIFFGVTVTASYFLSTLFENAGSMASKFEQTPTHDSTPTKKKKKSDSEE